MKTRKEKLAEELKKEMQRLKLGGRETRDHELAIEYLLNGEIKGSVDVYDILDACVNDFEMTCSDYGVKDEQMKNPKEPYDEFEKAGFFNLTDEKKETIKAVCEEANVSLNYFIELMKANAWLFLPKN